MTTRQKERLYQGLIAVLIFVCVLTCILPFMHMLAQSLSESNAVMRKEVVLWPKGFTLDTYSVIFKDRAMVRAMGFSIGVTLLYMVLALAVTVLAAYPLAKKRLRGRRFFMTLIIVTMYFSGGMIPDYILMRNLDLINKPWVLILPLMCSAYNMIILKTFFTSLPPSFEESAYIDGANDFQILGHIYLPLSKASLATLALFYAVSRWNGYTDVLLYITKPELYTIQFKLYQVVFNNRQLDVLAEQAFAAPMQPESIKAASIMFATIPILLVYPWLQKYFVNGVMLGGIKE